jgi:glucose/arabinose dehydrogenase
MFHRLRSAAAVLAGSALLGATPTVAFEVALELVAQGLTQPLGLVAPPDGSGRLFVVEQPGRIRILRGDGELLEEPFLDLTDQVIPLQDDFDERGLLGLALHPDFAANARLFVYYSAPMRADAELAARLWWDHTAELVEYQVTQPGPDRADPASRRVLLQVDQPHKIHNGGALLFGPDGHLYLGLGDGGANDISGDPAIEDYAQRTDVLLGKMLRLDVDGAEPYAIPADNPFVGQDGHRPEIFARGLRNPYRCSFDLQDGEALLCGDVGDFGYEEINLVVSGGNYGWRIMEGRHCYDQEAPTDHPESCASDGLLEPMLEYANCSNEDPCGGRAVIGGYVYRGSAIPELQGAYLFGDWSAAPDKLGPALHAATRADDGAWSAAPLMLAGGPLEEYVLGFGQDALGELYVLTSTSVGPDRPAGKVYRIVPAN